MNRALSALLVASFTLFTLSSCGSEEPEPKGKDTPGAESASVAGSYILTPAHYDTLTRNPVPLMGGRPSADSLVAAVLDGLGRSDTALLKELLVTRDEYMKVIYPELGKHWPGARDSRPEIADALWTNHAGNAMKGLRRALRDLGGRELSVKRVEFADGTKEYVSYTTHEGTIVTAADARGKEQKIGVIGSIVEKDGVFKLLSYRDREGE